MIKRVFWLLVVAVIAGLLLITVRVPEPRRDLYAAAPGEPIAGLSSHERRIFKEGEALFKHDFEPEEGLGPLFNGRSCFECHGKPNAAGREGRDVTTTGVVRIGSVLPKSPLDGNLNKAREEDDIYDFSGLIEKGGPAMQRRSITQEFASKYPPDCNIEVGVVPPEAQFISLRHSPPLLGFGLIEAIPEQAILANMIKQARQAPDLVGRTNPFVDPLTRTTKIGRFGWKDQNPDLLLFTAEALNTEMGVTTFIQNATRSSTGIVDFPPCIIRYLPPEPNDEGEKLVLLAAFQALIAPPSTPRPSPESKRGQEIFKKLRCAVCHTPEMYTAPYVEIPDPASSLPRLHYIEVKALENQPVRLYSDLLLHRMGAKLADGIVQVTARGGEWRTTPLWGLRYKKFYLHDGRTRSIDKAILAHGGQAAPVTEAYVKLPEADKSALLEFLKTL